MQHFPRRFLSVVSLLGLSLAFAACGSSNNNPPPGGDLGPVTDQDPVTDEDPPTPPPPWGLDARPPQQTCQAFTAPPTPAQTSFVNAFPGLTFSTPVSMTFTTDNLRFYVTERGGKIFSVPNPQSPSDPLPTNANKTLALDLSDIQFLGWDCSTAKIAFPPDFMTTGAAYVAYCANFPNPGAPPTRRNPHVQVRLSRFRSTDDGLTFPRESEQVLIAINYHENSDVASQDPGYSRSCSRDTSDVDGLHAGNAAHFGTDGFLYWAVGDGGPQGHCGGKQAQALSQLRGKLLRIDVSDLDKGLDPAVLEWPDPLHPDGAAADRVEVDDYEGWQYTAVDIPADNPYFGADPNPTRDINNAVVQPLIWASGFRNPWQWNFDPKDQTIWLGDVGNGTWEEINRNVVAGGNYGWGYFEGFYCANGWNTNRYPSTDTTFANACAKFSVDPNNHWPMLHVRHGPSYDVTNLEDDRTQPGPPYPQIETPNTPVENRLPSSIFGNAIVGGIVYRGTGVPSQTGSYFFGNYQGKIWVIPDVDHVSTASGTPCTSSAACGAGLVCKSQEIPYEDPDGEGPLFGYPPGLIWNNDADGPPPAPTGRCQADYQIVQTNANPASFARDMNNEIYIASLQGWIGKLVTTAATPGTGGPPTLLSQTGCFATSGQPVTDLVPFAPSAELWSDGATKRRWMTIPDDEIILLDENGDFEFPPGTMLVKEFSLAGKKVETRFITRQVADGAWAAYTYEWNDAQTDATLVGPLGAEKTWGTQVWSYPRRSQCFQCHTDIAKVALGPETAQLNHAIAYPATGRTSNQMTTLAYIDMIDATAAPEPYPDLLGLYEDGSVEERARAYLHVNCSGCHRPAADGSEGPTYTLMDLRYWVSFADMKVCNSAPGISDMEDIITPPGSSRLLVPGNREHSQIYKRMETTLQTYRMPPIARTIPHADALEVIGEWIDSIEGCGE